MDKIVVSVVVVVAGLQVKTDSWACCCLLILLKNNKRCIQITLFVCVLAATCIHFCCGFEALNAVAPDHAKPGK